MSATPFTVTQRPQQPFPELNRAELEALCLKQSECIAELLTAAKRALNTFKAQGEAVRPKNVLGALDAAIAKAERRS